MKSYISAIIVAVVSAEEQEDNYYIKHQAEHYVPGCHGVYSCGFDNNESADEDNYLVRHRYGYYGHPYADGTHPYYWGDKDNEGADDEDNYLYSQHYRYGTPYAHRYGHT